MVILLVISGKYKYRTFHHGQRMVNNLAREVSTQQCSDESFWTLNKYVVNFSETERARIFKSSFLRLRAARTKGLGRCRFLSSDWIKSKRGIFKSEEQIAGLKNPPDHVQPPPSYSSVLNPGFPNRQPPAFFFLPELFVFSSSRRKKWEFSLEDAWVGVALTQQTTNIISLRHNVFSTASVTEITNLTTALATQLSSILQWFWLFNLKSKRRVYLQYQLSACSSTINQPLSSQLVRWPRRFENCRRARPLQQIWLAFGLRFWPFSFPLIRDSVMSKPCRLVLVCYYWCREAGITMATRLLTTSRDRLYLLLIVGNQRGQIVTKWRSTIPGTVLSLIFRADLESLLVALNWSFWTMCLSSMPTIWTDLSMA